MLVFSGYPIASRVALNIFELYLPSTLFVVDSRCQLKLSVKFKTSALNISDNLHPKTAE